MVLASRNGQKLLFRLLIHMHFVSCAQKDVKDVEHEVIEVQDRKALYILQCENCVYTIQGRPIKISVGKTKNSALIGADSSCIKRTVERMAMVCLSTRRF